MLQKYFIAIVPPNALLLKIHELKQHIADTYQSKGALRSPGHITLHMPFAWDENKESKLVSCLENFKFNAAIDISLNGFSCFEPRVVFINVNQTEELSQLQKQLVRHVKTDLQLFNQADDMRGFHPHITIAFRDLKKAQFYKVWEEFQNKPFQQNFSCQSICLLKHVDNHWEVCKEFNFLN